MARFTRRVGPDWDWNAAFTLPRCRINPAFQKVSKDSGLMVLFAELN